MSDILKCFYPENDLPNKFIAIFSDGSGCNIFYYSHDDQYGVKMYTGTTAWSTDNYGVDKHWFVDAGYLWFIPLPDDFKVWGE